MHWGGALCCPGLRSKSSEHRAECIGVVAGPCPDWEKKPWVAVPTPGGGGAVPSAYNRVGGWFYRTVGPPRRGMGGWRRFMGRVSTRPTVGVVMLL